MGGATLNQETAWFDSQFCGAKIFPAFMTRRFSSGASMLGIAAVISILISCSTPQTRISDHPELYQSLSSRDQVLVSQGQIRSGMSRSAVWLAWGSPDQKIVGNMAGTPTETWIYIYYATYPYYPYYGPGPWGPWASNDSGPGYSLGYTGVGVAGSYFSAAPSTTHSTGRTSRLVSPILVKWSHSSAAGLCPSNTWRRTREIKILEHSTDVQISIAAYLTYGLLVFSKLHRHS